MLSWNIVDVLSSHQFIYLPRLVFVRVMNLLIIFTFLVAFFPPFTLHFSSYFKHDAVYVYWRVLMPGACTVDRLCCVILL
jgi:hypothetical protein